MRTPTYLVTFSVLALAACSPVAPVSVAPDPGRVVVESHAEHTAEEATEPTRPYGLMELLQLAEMRSPELRAAVAAARAAEGGARQAGLYPNPSVAYRESDLGLDQWSWDGGRSTVSLTQPLVLSGRINAATRAARARHAAALLNVHETRHRVYGQVHDTWVRIVYLGEALDLRFEMQALTQETSDLARLYKDALNLSPAVVARIDLEDRRVAQEILTVVTARTNETELLMALLGGMNITPNDITGSLLTTLPAAELAVSRSAALERHPELRVARARAEAARLDIDTARREAWPDPELSAGVGNSRASGENYLEAGISVAIPIFDRNQGRIAETGGLHTEAVELADAVENRLAARLVTLQQLLSEVDTLAYVYNQELVPSARQNLTATREEFRSGDATVADLIGAQRVYIDTRRLALDYIFDMNRYLAEFRHFNLYPSTSAN